MKFLLDIAAKPELNTSIIQKCMPHYRQSHANECQITNTTFLISLENLIFVRKHRSVVEELSNASVVGEILCLVQSRKILGFIFLIFYQFALNLPKAASLFHR